MGGWRTSWPTCSVSISKKTSLWWEWGWSAESWTSSHVGEPTHRIPLASFGHLRYFNYRCPRTTPQGFAHVTFMDSKYKLLSTPKANKIAVGYVGESCDMVCCIRSPVRLKHASLDSTAALQSVIDFECSFVEGTTDENKLYQRLSPYLETRYDVCRAIGSKTAQPSCSLQFLRVGSAASCPCAAPIATFSPTVEDCGGDAITCERCVNQKSEDLEDVQRDSRRLHQAQYSRRSLQQGRCGPERKPKVH